MRWIVVLAMGCYEDGSREYGEYCFEDADCGPGLGCDCSYCINEKDDRGLEGDAELETCEDDDAEGGYITCNDGTKSESCTTCSQGCCSSHGGCD